MDAKIKILLDKINLTKDYYPYFSDAQITKIKINSKTDSWNIFITKDELLPLEVYAEIEKKKNLLDEKATSIEFIYDIKNSKLETYLTYYKYLLNTLKEDLKVLEMYEESLIIKDDYLTLVVTTEIEKERLTKVLDKINNFYKKIGYKFNIDIEINHEENILEEIKSDLENISLLPTKQVKEKKTQPKDKEKKYYKEKKDPNNVIGTGIKDDPIKIKTLLGEDNNITIEGQVFGSDYFESSKTDFKIITLKITDFSDSIYCKIFVRDSEEYGRLCKEFKTGNWYKIRGYTKNDPFSKELVLNARDILKIEKKEENVVIDSAPIKRVELHAHTKMSQMDGLADEVELVKQAMAWGHKAIAITDHNGVQAFPHVFNMVTAHNKNLKEGEEPFKAIYGTELTMIDDSVNIVIRPTDKIMLDETFVVFDFETTGFNAGGSDSIIEIGAVKIKNGNIIEKYDELINPGHPLSQKIIDVTNITDEMLKDKDNEENAIKRFIAWYGDLPMVAHNAKFDVSFLEMAYKKYNLGTFTNPVIDTLELSRTLDNTYARHSLSALVKRYDVPWDEAAHHRGDYDAEGTALVFHKMLKKLSNRNIDKMSDLDKLVSKEDIHKYGRAHHINILVKNKVGLKNLFKLVSLANTTYLYKTPRIPRSIIEKHREGLLIGSGCYESEVFTEARSKSEDELSNIIRFYDYVEVQPLECYDHLIQMSDFATKVELAAHLEKIIRVTEDSGKILVATGDVHHIKRDDKIFREIIVNQKVPGGGRHPLARNNIKNIPSAHLRTTDEMLEDFNFLDKDLAYHIVVENTNKIAEMIEIVEVIIDTGGIPFSPRVKSDDGKSYLDCPRVVTDLVYTKAKDWYGEPLPHYIEERIATELYGDIVLKTIKEQLQAESLSEEELEVKAFSKLHSLILEGSTAVKELIKTHLLTTNPNLEKEEVEKQVKKVLGGIIGGGFDPIYLIAQRLVKHSNDEGYLVGSRGSVGSSFVATMMGITEVNPLPAHYRCKDCKISIFTDEEGNSLGATYSSGFDLPDKECPNCHIPLIKDGQDMPFATFLGFNADKVPDIDLNFSDLNQASAHAYTKVLFGEDNVYRAGTIGTVADKTAFGFVKGYCEEKGITDMRSAEIERLALGCTGVKRTTGQHPGGIVVIPDYMEVSDFTPFQFPAEDATAEWRTTHFDYHSIDQCLLKLDILGHSDPTQLRLIQLQSKTDIMQVPLDDKETMSIFTSTDALNVTKEQIMCNTGTLGIPEFGTPFTIKLVEDTKPTTFAELIKISGLSHGTDVWLGNAQELIQKNIVPFKETIGCRDDIMVYLMYHGLAPIKSFKIMEFVRKGKASKDPETWKEHVKTMQEADIPEWFISSCAKIKYMFPKAHAAAYVISAFRIAWYKVHMPVYFYASWYSSKATDVDIVSMINGYDAIKKKIEDIQTKGYEATNKENGQAESLKIALEATARNITFLNIDLYKSDATVWIAKNDHEIYPPFNAIDGLGDTVAKNIVRERELQPFISIEDVQKRGKVSQTLIEKMLDMGILKDLPESNQLSLF